MTNGAQNKGDREQARAEGRGLASLLAAAAAQSHPLPPVEQWSPPYCGDIGLEIRRDGTWYYQSSPIGRQAIVQVFSRILRRDADGRHYLVTPVEKVLVGVEDAPFMAVEMAVEGAGAAQVIAFRTNVGDIVRCGADHPLRFEPQSNGAMKPYVLVRGGLEALVNRAVYYELMELVEGGRSTGDTPGLWSSGRWFPLEA